MLWDEWRALARDEDRQVGVNEKGLLKAKHVKEYVLRLWFEEGIYFSIYDLDWKPLLVEEHPGLALLPLRDMKRFQDVRGDYELIWSAPDRGTCDKTSISLTPECVRFFCERYGIRIQPIETTGAKKNIFKKQDFTSLKFPTQEDWARILQNYPLAEINVLDRSFYKPEGDGSRQSDWGEPFLKMDVSDWIKHLHNRLCDICTSYVMMTFYFEQGIPDEEWHRPSRINKSEQYEGEQYFPHFTGDRHENQTKHYFDYYSNVFYLQLFSAFDNVGHILNVLYNLQAQRRDVSFEIVIEGREKTKRKKAIRGIREISPDLYDQIRQMTQKDAFESAKKLRNNITHNFLPGTLGESVVHKKKGNALITEFGAEQYTPSVKIHQTAVETLNILARVIASISIEA